MHNLLYLAIGDVVKFFIIQKSKKVVERNNLDINLFSLNTIFTTV